MPYSRPWRRCSPTFRGSPAKRPERDQAPDRAAVALSDPADRIGDARYDGRLAMPRMNGS